MRRSGSTPGSPRIRFTHQTPLKMPGIGPAESGQIRPGRVRRGGACPGPHRAPKRRSTPTTGVEAIGNSFTAYTRVRDTHRSPPHLLHPQPPAPLYYIHPLALAGRLLIYPVYSREAKRRVLDGTVATVGGQADTVWLNEQEVRALAAPLCEEDLSRRGDEIVLGERRQRRLKRR